MFANGPIHFLLDPVVHAAGVAFMAALLVTALWHKLTRRETFFTQMQAYQLVPQGLLPAAAWLLLFAEAATVLMLAFPSSRRAALLLCACLLLLYGTAMAIKMMQGRHDLDCGCGETAQSLSWTLVVRNVALAMLALIWSQAGLVREIGGWDILASIATFLGFWGLYQVAEELTRQAEKLRRLQDHVAH